MGQSAATHIPDILGLNCISPCVDDDEGIRRSYAEGGVSSSSSLSRAPVIYSPPAAAAAADASACATIGTDGRFAFWHHLKRGRKTPPALSGGEECDLPPVGARAPSSVDVCAEAGTEVGAEAGAERDIGVMNRNCLGDCSFSESDDDDDDDDGAFDDGNWSDYGGMDDEEHDDDEVVFDKFRSRHSSYGGLGDNDHLQNFNDWTFDDRVGGEG